MLASVLIGLIAFLATTHLPSIAGTSRLFGQEVETPEPLSIDSIYQQGKYRARGFQARWQEDGKGFERVERDTDNQEAKGNCIVRYSVDRPDEREVLVPAAMLVPAGKDRAINIESYQWSSDRTKLLIYNNSQRVWRYNTRGDYWLLDIATKTLKQLGTAHPPSSMMFAKFSPQGDKVGYVFQNDIYVENLADGTTDRLTTSDSETKIYGTFDWVYEEEFSIRDGFQFSPDGTKVAFWEIDCSGIERFPLVDNTATLYPKVQWIYYPKVGTTNPAARLGVIQLANHETTWLKIPGEPRDHYLPRMEWAGNSDEILVQQFNRLQNTQRVFLANVQSGNVRSVLLEKDIAWVDLHDEVMWMKDHSRFTWISERNGWRHVYLVSRNGSQVTQMTHGDFDVIQLLGMDEENRWIYFIASPTNAAQRYFYRSKFDGSELTKLSPANEEGTHQIDLSPNRQFAFTTFSNFGTPPVTRLIRLSDSHTIKTFETNEQLAAKLNHPDQPTHEFIRVAIGNGVELDGWCILPPKLDPTKKYPLIVYVYGEPAGQTVLDSWGGDRTMWHRMLAQQGFVVMSFDNRGTPAPRGRSWRKSIYKKVGVQASADQAEAVRAVLASRSYLDADRVGVWGWSGGGSMTLNALFRYPKLYKSGVSIAPVPNQLYYDTIYQERYMSIPSQNEEGYREGSPITFASQLEGELLLIHGTGDDNCHYQTTELLINELIKHNKQFSMFAYPNRTHAIREGENTTPHLQQMITNHFLRTLRPTDSAK